MSKPGVRLICPFCGTERCWEILDLPARAKNCLRQFTRVRTIDDVAAYTEAELLRVKNLGKISVAFIKEALAECGLSLACVESEREYGWRVARSNAPYGRDVTMTDFHIYQSETQTNITIDPNDPQREEALRAVSNVMNDYGRSREADECIEAISWKGAV